MRIVIIGFVMLAITVPHNAFCGEHFEKMTESMVQTAESPGIGFTFIPDYGAYGFVEGQAEGIVFADYRVAVFIQVGDLWWTKPTYANPLSSIDPTDGTWTCNITTGGYDRFSTKVAAFLVPEGITPPKCDPCDALPSVPDAVAETGPVVRPGSPPTKTVRFSGYDWKVKRRDFPDGPGPNYFSDSQDSVWVDDGGNLHMAIRHDGANWLCSEAILEHGSFGYGTYIWQMSGDIVNTIDPMMVLGAFTWDPSARNESFREIDFEISRWADPEMQTDSQYVIQPCNACPGCGDQCERFTIGPVETGANLTHYLVWQPERVEMRTYRGLHADAPPIEELVHAWTHTGEDVPKPGNEHVRLNFWLFNGDAPLHGSGEEVVIKAFAWQDQPPWSAPPAPKETRVSTNLPNYPIAGCAETADEVRINNQPVALDDYGGYRQDALLENGNNKFEIISYYKGQVIDASHLEIDFDPAGSTIARNLLYAGSTSGTDNSVVIDLDANQIIGFIPGNHIVSTSPDGRFVIDKSKNVYNTENHQKWIEPLPFSSQFVHPVVAFIGNETYVWAEREKCHLENMEIISSDLPIFIDARRARTVAGDILIQGEPASEGRGIFTKFDLINDEITSQTNFSRRWVYLVDCMADASGSFGLVTSYAYAQGALQMFDLDTGQEIFSEADLGDYMGQIAMSQDDRYAFVGSYGNSHYGKGGVYVFDMQKKEIVDYYHQFGAASVVVGQDGLIYTSTRFVDDFGDGTWTLGMPGKRGVDVLRLNENQKLEHVRSFYLNEPHDYFTHGNLQIKPGFVITGDADRSGRVDMQDLMLILQILCGADVSDQIVNEKAAIGNELGIGDVIYILQIIAGLKP